MANLETNAPSLVNTEFFVAVDTATPPRLMQFFTQNQYAPNGPLCSWICTAVVGKFPCNHGRSEKKLQNNSIFIVQVHIKWMSQQCTCLFYTSLGPAVAKIMPTLPCFSKFEFPMKWCAIVEENRKAQITKITPSKSEAGSLDSVKTRGLGPDKLPVHSLLYRTKINIHQTPDSFRT